MEDMVLDYARAVNAET